MNYICISVFLLLPSSLYTFLLLSLPLSFTTSFSPFLLFSCYFNFFSYTQSIDLPLSFLFFTSSSLVSPLALVHSSTLSMPIHFTPLETHKFAIATKPPRGGTCLISLLSVIDNACHLSIPVSCYKDNAAPTWNVHSATLSSHSIYAEAGQGIKLRVLLPASPPSPLPSLPAPVCIICPISQSVYSVCYK